MYAITYCVHNVQNSVVGRGGRGGGVIHEVCRITYLDFINFHFQKVIIGIKLKIKICNNVIHNIIYKMCLVISNKSCLKSLKLSALVC